MRRTDRPGVGQPGMISVQEIACWAFYPEQWWLQYGMGLKPENRKSLAAGNQYYTRKAVVERAAGGFITLRRMNDGEIAPPCPPNESQHIPLAVRPPPASAMPRKPPHPVRWANLANKTDDAP